MNVKIEESWKELLKEEFSKEYFLRLTAFVKEAYGSGVVYPPGSMIFRAFDSCPVDQVRVVILGQDPYHGEGQANGLCFSVGEGVRFPPSLLNIFKELKDDLGKEIPPHGSLERWAREGVLLLNATLTVRAHEAGSHQKRGWEEFTDAAIRNLAEGKEGIVFILWGSYAQKKGSMIDSKKHHMIKCVHPSPLSAHRGFFGSKPFSEANAYLQSIRKKPVEW